MPESANPWEQPASRRPEQDAPSSGRVPGGGPSAPGGQSASGQLPASGHGEMPGWAAPQPGHSFAGRPAPGAAPYPGGQPFPAVPSGFGSPAAPAGQPGSADSSRYTGQPGLNQPGIAGQPGTARGHSGAAVQGGQWGGPGSTPASPVTPGYYGAPASSFPGAQGYAPQGFPPPSQGHASQGFPPAGTQHPGAPGAPFATAPAKRGPVKRWALIASIVSGCLVLVLVITAVVMSSAPARAERIPGASSSSVAEGPSHPDPVPFAKVALRELPGVVMSADGWHPSHQVPSEEDKGYESLWFHGDDENCYMLIAVRTDFKVSNLDDRTATEAYVQDMMSRSQSISENPSVREQAITGGGSLEMIDFRGVLPTGTDAMISARIFAGSGHAMVILGTCDDGSDPSAMVREFREKASITILPS